jgi:hypothetical protein
MMAPYDYPQLHININIHSTTGKKL